MRTGTGLGLTCALILVGAAGCGSGDNQGDDVFADARPPADGPDGGGSTGADAGGLADGPSDISGPVVSVLVPAEPASLDSDEIVVGDRLVARCRVEPNPNTGDGVDTSSVRVTAFGVAGKTRQAIAQPTTVEDEFQATLVLSDFFNGDLTIRCDASDLADPPRSNSAEHATYLDLGPSIVVFSPLDGGSYANAVDVNFRVSADPVASGDTGATPNLASGVHASIAGVDITGDLTHPSADVFRYTVKFHDARFVPPLDGPQTVVITAANTRSPSPVVRERTVEFLADSAGPTITVDEPAAGQLVAGILHVSATITDPAGVDELSVVATIAQVHDFDLVHVGGDTFVGSFDTRQLPTTMVYPNLIVRARDSVGNERAVGLIITLDNLPPIVDLDPPPMREMEYQSSREANQCSWFFDPLGSNPFFGDDNNGDPGDASAADDGESVPQLSEMRARIEDRGNGATATLGTVVPMAGVDLASAQIYVLDDASRALVVDTDGDGVCDDINPNIVPTTVPLASNEAAVVDLTALTPAGVGVFIPGDPDPFDHSPGSYEFMCFEGDDQDTQLPLCVQEPGSRITSMPDGTPVIFGMSPPSEDQCWGNAFDSLAANISDGWACVAVRALDNVGNVGVSRPLRVCFDADGNQAECLPWGQVATSGLPDCTGTYDPDTGITDAGTPCTLPVGFADYPDRQLRCLGSCPRVNIREIGFCNFLEVSCGDYEGPDGIYYQSDPSLYAQEICYDDSRVFDSDEDNRAQAVLTLAQTDTAAACIDAEALALCHQFEDICIYGTSGYYPNRNACINAYDGCGSSGQASARSAMLGLNCAGVVSACP